MTQHTYLMKSKMDFFFAIGEEEGWRSSVCVYVCGVEGQQLYRVCMDVDWRVHFQ